jgi:hypothetical protein
MPLTRTLISGVQWGVVKKGQPEHDIFLNSDLVIAMEGARAVRNV